MHTTLRTQAQESTKCHRNLDAFLQNGSEFLHPSLLVSIRNNDMHTNTVHISKCVLSSGSLTQWNMLFHNTDVEIGKNCRGHLTCSWNVNAVRTEPSCTSLMPFSKEVTEIHCCSKKYCLDFLKPWSSSALFGHICIIAQTCVRPLCVMKTFDDGDADDEPQKPVPTIRLKIVLLRQVRRYWDIVLLANRNMPEVLQSRNLWRRFCPRSSATGLLVSCFNLFATFGSGPQSVLPRTAPKCHYVWRWRAGPSPLNSGTFEATGVPDIVLHYCTLRVVATVPQVDS